MTTHRPIRPYKGGRTARAPEARIRPQTLERIYEAMREQGKTFADLLEDQYSGGNEMAEKEHEYRYYENGELYDKSAPGKWMTAAEAKKRNRDLNKSPDSIAISRKWIRTSK